MVTELLAETQHGITHAILKVSEYAQRLRGERIRTLPAVFLYVDMISALPSFPLDYLFHSM